MHFYHHVTVAESLMQYFNSDVTVHFRKPDHFDCLLGAVGKVDLKMLELSDLR